MFPFDSLPISHAGFADNDVILSLQILIEMILGQLRHCMNSRGVFNLESKVLESFWELS